MFSDPQALIVNTTTLSLPAISRGTDSSVYRYTDTAAAAVYTFTVSHQFKKRNRFSVRMDINRVVTDPLVPANSVPASASVYTIIDLPVDQTITDVDAGYYLTALRTWLATSTNGTRVIGGET